MKGDWKSTDGFHKTCLSCLSSKYCFQEIVWWILYKLLSIFILYIHVYYSLAMLLFMNNKKQKSITYVKIFILLFSITCQNTSNIVLYNNSNVYLVGIWKLNKIKKYLYNTNTKDIFEIDSHSQTLNIGYLYSEIV